MLRETNGRFKSAPSQPSRDSNDVMTSHKEDNVVEKFFAFLSNLIRDGRVKTAIVCLAVASAIYATATPALLEKGIGVFPAVMGKESPAKEPDLIPGKISIWTFDSDDNSVQHRDIDRLEGSTSFRAKYVNRETKNTGVIIGYRRIDGNTIALSYASDDVRGNGLGYIVFRQLKSPSDADPPVWIGFEMGHDCLCGSTIPHEGEFTSLPAILTTTPEPPAYLVEIVTRAKTQKQDYVWPREILEKTKKP